MLSHRIWSSGTTNRMTTSPTAGAAASSASRRSRVASRAPPLIGAAASYRAVALGGDAVHDASMTVIVVDRVVLDAAVVPQQQRPRVPAEAAGELRPYRVLPQIFEQSAALG